MTKKTPSLSVKFYKINSVTIPQLMEMHGIFVNYYHNADLQTFIKDMCKKQGIFLLVNKSTGTIVGFSTWNEIDIVYKNKKSIGVFSGDTIVEEQYWGDKTLQKAFAIQLFKLKLKRMNRDVYWLLISKGYKTYLLMANNFLRYYPHYTRSNKKLESVVDHYCNLLYPDAYKLKDRLLDFGDDYQHLKGGVAEITDDMKTNNPKIKFFDELNPAWRKGIELPCVGEVSMSMLWRFTKKNMLPFSNKPRPVYQGETL